MRELFVIGALIGLGYIGQSSLAYVLGESCRIYEKAAHEGHCWKEPQMDIKAINENELLRHRDEADERVNSTYATFRVADLRRR